MVEKGAQLRSETFSLFTPVEGSQGCCINPSVSYHPYQSATSWVQSAECRIDRHL